MSRLAAIVIDRSLGEDFIRTARAKGIREGAVLFKHALQSLLPMLTVMGPLTATLLTGSFVVEYVFAIPGMGRFFITAVTDRDYPLIMGVTLIYTALLVGANLLVDLFMDSSIPESAANDHGRLRLYIRAGLRAIRCFFAASFLS